MLLRSSSTPVLGSLLSSIPESPNNNFHCEAFPKHPPTSVNQKHHSIVSFNQTGSVIFFSSSCNSSPMSPSILGLEKQGFRRAQSEGNLQALLHASYNDGTNSRKVLEPIPSFSRSNSRTSYDYEDEEEEEEERFDIQEDQRQKGVFDVKIENKSAAREGQVVHLCTAVERISANLNEKWESGLKNGNLTFEVMHLARGLGLQPLDESGNGASASGGGDGGGWKLPRFGGGRGGGDDNDNCVEAYYKRMVEENPGNALFLRNYAQFLHQSKRDLEGADEYYCRAILADPNDGDVLSQYANLVWELNRDQDRAESYHQQAIKASPQDSHVQAAYAGFLWETEQDEDGPRSGLNHDPVLASAGASELHTSLPLPECHYAQ